MAPSPCCGLFGSASDNWRHALIDCHIAKCVWALTDEELAEHFCQSSEEDARLWIFEMMNSVKHEEFISIITMWAIWYARHKALLDEEFEHQSPSSTHSFIQCFVQDLSVAKPKTQTKQAAERMSGPKPLPPPQDVVKINFDPSPAKSQAKGGVAAS
jgi:hypothetical protein